MRILKLVVRAMCEQCFGGGHKRRTRIKKRSFSISDLVFG